MKTLQEMLIKKRGKMSIREAAKLIGISHSYLIRLEKGIDPRSGAPISPTPEVLRLISKAYNIEYEILMIAAGHTYNAEKIEQVIQKEYKEELEYLDKFIEEMKARGYDYSHKTRKEIAELFVKLLKDMDGKKKATN